MFKMKTQNKEMLDLALEGVATPREIAATYGVEVKHIYRLRHNHNLKIRKHEAKAQKLREMDKRKKEEVKVKVKAEVDAKSVVRRKGWWGKLQIEKEREAIKPVQRFQKHHNADELQKIAITARKLHAISVAQGATPTQPEDYFERLKGAQTEIDRLLAESADQRKQIKDLMGQNSALLRIISKHM